MRDPVTLTRAPLHIPLAPQSRESGVRWGKGAAVPDDPASAPASATSGNQEEFSDPTAGAFSAVLDSARVPDNVRADVHAWAEGRGPAAQGHDDAADIAAADAELRRVWNGDGEYERNMAAVAAYVGRLPEVERAALFEPRDENGRALGNDAANIVRIAGLARGPQPQAMTIEGIEAFMRSNRAAYNRDEPLQARYRELLDARTKGK